MASLRRCGARRRAARRLPRRAAAATSRRGTASPARQRARGPPPSRPPARARQAAATAVATRGMHPRRAYAGARSRRQPGARPAGAPRDAGRSERRRDGARRRDRIGGVPQRPPDDDHVRAGRDRLRRASRRAPGRPSPRPAGRTPGTTRSGPGPDRGAHRPRPRAASRRGRPRRRRRRAARAAPPPPPAGPRGRSRRSAAASRLVSTVTARTRSFPPAPRTAARTISAPPEACTVRSDAPRRGGAARGALDGVRDVVELQVEEDRPAERRGGAHRRRPLRGEQLQADLEHADRRRDRARERLGLRPRGEVERGADPVRRASRLPHLHLADLAQQPLRLRPGQPVLRLEEREREELLERLERARARRGAAGTPRSRSRSSGSRPRRSRRRRSTRTPSKMARRFSGSRSNQVLSRPAASGSAAASAACTCLKMRR